MIRLNPVIELACASDADEISTLSRDEVEYGLRRKYTADRIRSLIEDGNKNVIVARDNERLLGFGIMTYRDSNANLDLLAVKQDFRRSGIASGIVDWLVAVARGCGVPAVYVQARESNSGAGAFYCRLGFRRIDEIIGYYQGKESAVIYCKELRPVFTYTEDINAGCPPRPGMH